VKVIFNCFKELIDKLKEIAHSKEVYEIRNEFKKRYEKVKKKGIIKT